MADSFENYEIIFLSKSIISFTGYNIERKKIHLEAILMNKFESKL